MKFCIMCGGKYDTFTTPRQLLKINGESLVERTIRLLRENGENDIVITATDKRFDGLGVPRLEHNNSFELVEGKLKGYWLDAFYPFDEPVTYLFGDVYFSDTAIKAIRDIPQWGGYEDKNILLGSAITLTGIQCGRNWGEPFAYVVNDTETFRKGIEAVKKLQDEGKTTRMPIVWELYRYLNGIDINTHDVRASTFVVIDDETNDIDSIEEYHELREVIE